MAASAAPSDLDRRDAVTGMTWPGERDDLARVGARLCEESRRLVLVARAAITRSRAARAQATQSRDARAEANRADPLARRAHLLAVKAREITKIEQAIQLYVDAARRWREHGMTVMAHQLEAKASVERERLALAIAERDAWPPASPQYGPPGRRR